MNDPAPESLWIKPRFRLFKSLAEQIPRARESSWQIDGGMDRAVVISQSSSAVDPGAWTDCNRLSLPHGTGHPLHEPTWPEGQFAFGPSPAALAVFYWVTKNGEVSVNLQLPSMFKKHNC